ncbi:MAG: response regulator [Verrucomicrobium sp.]
MLQSQSFHGHPPAPKALRILLVEDHADTSFALSRLLAKRGHEVLTASKIEEARRRVADQSFQLILCDIGLPDGSGTEFVSEQRAKGNQTPAIALTGFGMEEDVHECLNAGFQKHLTKPLNLQKLLETIEEVMAGK